MYFVTDLWQKWIALYENLRNVKPDLWINMTCYVNVSPWWLQWVNSLWLQNSTDIGFADNQEKQAQVDAEEKALSDLMLKSEKEKANRAESTDAMKKDLDEVRRIMNDAD